MSFPFPRYFADIKKLPGLFSLGVYSSNNAAYTRTILSTCKVLWLV